MLVSALVGTPVAGIELLRERAKPGPGGNWDLIIFAAMPLWVAHLTLSGLDIGRYHWSDAIPGWLHILGLLGLAASSGIMIWAMGVNKFFSSVIRLQSERGHRVISEGPYAYVRHPGYAAMLVFTFASPLALGSLVGGLPLLLLLCLVLLRTVNEDRFLRERLPGYSTYAEKVRYRLIPCIW